MTSSSSTDFGPKDGRRFAFPVGTAFLLLAAVLVWRERTPAAIVMVSLGGTLWAAGAVIPARLGPIYRGWMGMALLISRVTTPVFLGIVYFLVLTPTGLIMRLFGKRPIVHKLDGRSYWQSTAGHHKGDLSRQF